MNDAERDYNELVQRAFRAMAPIYDLMTIPIRRLRDEAVNFAGPEEGSAVLDVATGTGDQALAFARRGFRVTGIDLTDAMLERAVRKQGSEKVRFELGDATCLRFPTNAFDVVSVSFALHDMPPTIRERVLREMTRVAKPGGTILIVDYGLPRNRLGRFLVYRLVDLYEGETYREFIRSDLHALLAKVGISLTGERIAVLGAAKVWKGRIVSMPIVTSQVKGRARGGN
jgi:demethylmenaquinone methyltransferase/2-methoxy-6-polyprenyl-1,4-benzoquinol methylase